MNEILRKSLDDDRAETRVEDVKGVIKFGIENVSVVRIELLQERKPVYECGGLGKPFTEQTSRVKKSIRLINGINCCVRSNDSLHQKV